MEYYIVAEHYSITGNENSWGLFFEENWSILLGSIKQFSLVSPFERVRSLLLRV